MREGMSSASPAMMLSQDAPPPPPDLGCRLSAVLRRASVSASAQEMLAFSCSPNTSGPSVNGSPLMKST